MSIIDNQSYYDLPNGKQVKDITKWMSFDSGNVIKYNGRAGRKHKDKEREDLSKVLTYLTYLSKEEYLTSPFMDKLDGIRKLLRKRGKSIFEIQKVIQPIKDEFTANIDSLTTSFESENRKQVIYWIYNFLLSESEEMQRKSLQRAIKYIKLAIQEVDER